MNNFKRRIAVLLIVAMTVLTCVPTYADPMENLNRYAEGESQLQNRQETSQKADYEDTQAGEETGLVVDDENKNDEDAANILEGDDERYVDDIDAGSEIQSKPIDKPEKIILEDDELSEEIAKGADNDGLFISESKAVIDNATHSIANGEGTYQAYEDQDGMHLILHDATITEVSQITDQDVSMAGIYYTGTATLSITLEGDNVIKGSGSEAYGEYGIKADYAGVIINGAEGSSLEINVIKKAIKSGRAISINGGEYSLYTKDEQGILAGE